MRRAEVLRLVLNDGSASFRAWTTLAMAVCFVGALAAEAWLYVAVTGALVAVGAAMTRTRVRSLLRRRSAGA